MTEGSIWGKLAAFSIPLLIGNIVQQLYNTVDSIVVGQYVGDVALAAVGSAFPIIMLILVLFMGVSTGASIMVAQYYGAKDRKTLSKTIGSTISLMLISSVIVMIVGPLVTRPLLLLLQTPVEVLELCEDYLIIIFIGIAGMVLYNGVSGILRGMGDALVPLLILFFACMLNIALDLLFVAVFGWGVAGAAWATVVAQLLSSVLCFMRLSRLKDIVDLNLGMLKPDKALCLQIGKLGLPAALTQMIFSLANIVVQSLINSFGTEFIACSAIVMRVDGFAMMPNFTFGMAMATFVGQNIGAGKMDRVKQGVKSGMIMGVSVSTVMVVSMLFFGKALMRVFTSTASLIEYSNSMLRVLAVGYISMAVMQILSGVMRGAGDTMSPMWISLATTVFLRTPLAYLMAYLTRSPEYPNGRPEIVFISLLVAWVIGAVLSVIFYRMGKWKSKSVVSTEVVTQE
jgi:putative MATE family efflux protein